MERWKAFRLYTTFNFGYLCFLIGYVVLHFHYGSLYDLVLFYFEAPYSDFIIWFPRHHAGLFAAVVGLKIIGVFSIGLLLWTVIRYRTRISRFFQYNMSHGYSNFIRTEGSILLCALVYYIALYWIVRIALQGSIYSDVQVLVARGFLFNLIMQIAVMLLGHWVRVLANIKTFLLTPQLPYNIAVLRILFFSYLGFLYFSKWLTASDNVSLESRVALPGIGWLIDVLPISPNIYSWMVVMGIVACTMVVLGFRTRIFLILNAAICFYIYATPNFFGKLWHEQLVIWIAWFFAISRCYDVLSLDARKAKTGIAMRSDYTFPVRLIWLQLGVIYFWAGFYKLWESGFDWALGASMINQVQLEWFQNYDNVPSIRIDQWPILLHVGGLVAILFEISYLFLLLQPRLRAVAAIGGLVMHNLIGWFMYISFFHTIQVFYLSFLDFNRFFVKKSVSPHSVIHQLSKPTLYLGSFILSMNFLFGMFSIDSYPFSAYPKYAALIPDTVKYIQWEGWTPANKVFDAHEVGKANGFLWESYGWLEHNLIRDYENGLDVSQRTHDYWNIWRSHNPQLAACDSVVATIMQRPVAPEGINQISKRGALATLHVSEKR